MVVFYSGSGLIAGAGDMGNEGDGVGFFAGSLGGIFAVVVGCPFVEFAGEAAGE